MKLRASTLAKTAALTLKLSKSSQEAVEDVASRLVAAQLVPPPGLADAKANEKRIGGTNKRVKGQGGKI